MSEALQLASALLEAEPGSARSFLRSLKPMSLKDWLEPLGLSDMGNGKRFCSAWYPLKTPWEARLEVSGDMRHRYSLCVVFVNGDEGKSHAYRNVYRPELPPEKIREAVSRTIQVLLEFLKNPPVSRAGFVTDVLKNLDMALDAMEGRI